MAPNRSGSAAGAVRIVVLVAVLLVSGVTYYTAKAAGVYLDYREFRQAIRQEGRQLNTLAEDTIRHRLQHKADELDLPEAAKELRFERRGANHVVIAGEYQEIIALPFYRWAVTLRPEVRIDF